MTGLVLRPPAGNDVAHLVSRQGELYAEEYGWDDTFRQLVAGIFADFRAGPRARVWIADLEGEIAGSVMAVPASEDTGQLRCMYVEPRFRGRGIGTALIDACVEFCRAAGYRRIRLWTMHVLTDAARLYEAAGFERIEATSGRHFGHDLTEEVWELVLA